MVLELVLADLLAARVGAVEVPRLAFVGEMLLIKRIRDVVLATLVGTLEGERSQELCRQIVGRVLSHVE